ncbi:CDAN1 family protein [Megaselia abdita]
MTPEEILQKLCREESGNFQQFFLSQFSSKCSVEEFGVFFLNFLRQQIEVFLKGCNGSTATPLFTPLKPEESQVSIKDCSSSSLTLDPKPILTKKKIRTSLFEQSDFPEVLNKSLDNRMKTNVTSTPKQSKSTEHSFNSTQTSANNSRSIREFSLEDFMNTSTPSNRVKSKKQVQKKRVVPITLSKSINDSDSDAFTSPAFRNDNNILKINDTSEIMDRQKMKTEMTEISKQIDEIQPPVVFSLRSSVAAIAAESPLKTKPVEISLENVSVENQVILKRLAEIYCILMDLHLTANILSEISFILNILDADGIATSPSNPEADIEEIDRRLINVGFSEVFLVFKEFTNCVFFALEVLNRRRGILAVLDLSSLKVVIENNRITSSQPQLTSYLQTVYSKKSDLIESSRSNHHDTSFPSNSTVGNSVFLQQENDTRNNFSSDLEFANFRKQRDAFYAILKTWEQKHMNPLWNFKESLGSKIQNTIFNVSEHPINMAHLAQLFLAQLLLSANEPLPQELSDVDQIKLSKLTQRLVTPGSFSTNYQFPGNQIFFKQFLQTAGSHIFMEQIKLVLVANLIELNDSTYDILNLSSSGGSEETTEYVVRTEVISNLRILSKFLGLVVSIPFTYEGNKNSLMDQKQMDLKNNVSSTIDFFRILKKALIEKKLLITIPWMVQYLVMLDEVSLKHNEYKRVFSLLFEIYWKIDVLKLRHTSNFIILSCLGWLFEQLNLVGDYYVHRQMKNPKTDLNFLMDFQEVPIYLPHNSNVVKEMEENVLVGSVTKVKTFYQCSLVKKTFDEKEVFQSSVSSSPSSGLLETILNASCPFLADFRVAIMPKGVAKSLSRTGRYRHITTKIMTEQSTPNVQQQNVQDNKSKLVEAFLHSQSLSVRRTIEFVIERTSSAVIKDFQVKFLLPSKTTAMENIQNINDMDYPSIFKNIKDIFTKSFNIVLEDWNTEVPKMIEERASQALAALLPTETQSVVKQTCLQLVKEKCLLKTTEWRKNNLKDLSFYSTDIQSDAEKFQKQQQNKNGQHTNLVIRQENTNLSESLDELQYWLHNTSYSYKFVNSKDLLVFLKKYKSTFEENTLPYFFFRVTGLMTINLIQNLICYFPMVLNAEVIEEFMNIWQHEEMLPLVFGLKSSSNIFDGLLTVYFFRSLQRSRNTVSYVKLGDLLSTLVEARLITPDYLNDAFLKLYKHQWPQFVLNGISEILRTVIGKSNSEMEKPVLMMDVLADIVRNVEMEEGD